jgi:serine/threonine protein kinase
MAGRATVWPAVPKAVLPEGFEPTGPPLGMGATAVVWPARHTLDGQEVALKVWRRPFRDDQERQRFLKEIETHCKLAEASAHVVTYVWSGEHGLPWLGMARHGRSLRQVLQDGRPPLSEGLVLCEDLLAGLATVHAAHLFHRDVNPKNILVNEGRGALCDLGLAMDADGITQDNQAGTEGYLAPELKEGRVPGYRTDVYSAAVTIREVLGPDVPEPLLQVLVAAESFHPQDRPADAGEFVRRFAQARQQLGYPNPPLLRPRDLPPAPGEAHPTFGPRNRLKALVWAGLILLILLMSGLTASGLSHRREEPLPDASRAPADITPDGRAVVLPEKPAAQCTKILPGTLYTGSAELEVGGQIVGVVKTYYQPELRQMCAKLVKSDNSPLLGKPTHLALTLCGDSNRCDYDWHTYKIDAGPVVVPSRTGCVSWRVSMANATDTNWLVRDQVRRTGC